MPAEPEDGRPATRAELHAVEGRLTRKIANLDAKIDSSVQRLDAKIDSSVQRLDAKIDSSAQRLDAKIGSSVQRLDAKIDRVALELVKTQADVREIKETMVTKMATKDDVSRILGAIDAFARQSERADRAMVLHGQALTEHSVQLNDHEKRIASFETPRS